MSTWGRQHQFDVDGTGHRRTAASECAGCQQWPKVRRPPRSVCTFASGGEAPVADKLWPAPANRHRDFAVPVGRGSVLDVTGRIDVLVQAKAAADAVRSTRDKATCSKLRSSPTSRPKQSSRTLSPLPAGFRFQNGRPSLRTSS
jgi:hypothetical protein